MKKLRRLLLPMIMLGILVLSNRALLGATSGPTLGPSFKQAEIPADKAVVYIYRPSPPSGFAGNFAADVGIPFDVKVNGKVVTILAQGGYCTYLTEPGKIEFTAIEGEYSGSLAAKSPFSVTVDAMTGQTYYLKGAHGHSFVPRLSLVLISPEVGAKEIASCKLIMTTLGSTSGPISTSMIPEKTVPSTSIPTPDLSSQQAEMPTDKAVVYIYHSGGSNHFFILKANGKDVTGLKKGQYYAYVTEPGTIEFLATTRGTCSITLDVKAGQAYYLKGSVPPGFSPTPSLVSVSPEVGAKGIASCKIISSPR